MFKPFESIRVWHDARRFAMKIYAVSGAREFSGDSGLRNQLRRAAISTMSNIAEGHERSTPKEFAHFLRIAKGSIGEVRAQLYIAEDIGYLNPESAKALREQAAAISRQLAGLMQRQASN